MHFAVALQNRVRMPTKSSPAASACAYVAGYKLLLDQPDPRRLLLEPPTIFDAEIRCHGWKANMRNYLWRDSDRHP